MATIRLIPSTYYLSNSNYLSVSDANNMYANTDSTNYATVTNTRTSTSSYYIYIRGFDFNDVPSDAIVNSITIKLKASHSGGNTSTIYCYDGTTQVTAAGSTTALGTSATVKTFTNTTVDWDTLKSYGSDFGIRINCRRSSRNTTSYVYIYGAEILVDYTIPVYHDVSITNNSQTVTTDPSTTQTILEGNDAEILFYNISNLDAVDITDNGTSIKSQLVQAPGTSKFIPTNSTNSGFTITNLDNAYADIDSADYASLGLAARNTGDFYLDFSVSLPSTAVIQSVVPMVTLQYNRNGSSSGFTAECQMYSGSSYKGSTTTIVSAGGTDVAKTTFTLNSGIWTLSELSNARLYITAENNASGTQRFLYVYGASLEVTFEFDGVIYKYTISNIVADHNIVINDVAPQQSVYRKVNNAWSKYSKIYVKQNNVWVEQSDFEAVFQSNKIYVDK